MRAELGNLLLLATALVVTHAGAWLVGRAQGRRREARRWRDWLMQLKKEERA